MTIKSVVFDVGGVLVRTENQAGRRELEKRFDMKEYDIDWLVFDSKEAMASTVGQMAPDDIWQAVGERLGLSPEELPEFIELFWQGDVFDQALFNFLVSLKPDYITGILSNAWKGAREDFANRYGIIEGENVDHVLVSCELGLAKPDPEIYYRLRETVGVAFDEILFVDDFSKNIKAANALGINTIHYRTGINLINQIKSMLD
jgi:putative hydrolase of the HAD superfamily